MQGKKKHQNKINSFDYIRNENSGTSKKRLKEKCNQHTVKKITVNKTDKSIIYSLYKKITQFGKKNTKKSIGKW